MVYFQTKNPNVGKFWEGLSMEDVLWPFGTFYGNVVYFVAIWYIFLFWYVVPRSIWQP
jgi:hypothetical protein